MSSPISSSPRYPWEDFHAVSRRDTIHAMPSLLWISRILLVPLELPLGK